MMYRNQPDKRNQLLQKINEVSFALDDILLYLDTHPCCEKGMAYYREQAEKRKKLMKELPGNGWNSRFHGKGKEGADSLCGIMKNDYSIL